MFIVSFLCFFVLLLAVSALSLRGGIAGQAVGAVDFGLAVAHAKRHGLGGWGPAAPTE